MTERSLNMKARRYLALQAECKALEKEMEKLKAEMLEVMGDKELLETEKFILKFPFVNGSRFDTKTFKEKHPDLYNIFNIANPYRKFSVAEKGA